LPEWVGNSSSLLLIIAEKEKKRIELGLPDPKAAPADTFNHNFIQRPMLRLPDPSQKESCKERITIMTYNVLAQSLIRRRLFPSSGNFLNLRRRLLTISRRHTKMEKSFKNVDE
jgi:hypothetical protein